MDRQRTVWTVRRVDDRAYELEVDGQIVGTATIQERDGVVVIPHTEIDPSRRGEGWGTEFVRAVLDDLDARGQRVVPQCPFVARFVEMHPEYGPMVA